MTYRSFLDFVVSLQFNIQNKELCQWHSVPSIGRHNSFLVTTYTTECDSICTNLNHIWLSLQYQNLLAYFTVKKEWRAVWSGRLVDIFTRQIWSIWTRCIYLKLNSKAQKRKHDQYFINHSIFYKSIKPEILRGIQA